MIEVLILVVLLLTIGVAMSTASAPTDPRSSMEEAARRERQRVARAQTRAENEINRLTHEAFEEMIDEVDRVRREAQQ